MRWNAKKIVIVTIAVCLCFVLAYVIAEQRGSDEKTFTTPACALQSIELVTSEPVLISRSVSEKPETKQTQNSSPCTSASTSKVTHSETSSTVSAPTRSKTWIDGLTEEEYRLKVMAWESGGDYNAHRQGTSYYGAYQIHWGYHASKYAATPEEFMASPALQDKAAWDYVSARYGSWAEAFRHISTHGWY